MTDPMPRLATGDNSRATIGDNSDKAAPRTEVKCVPVNQVGIWEPAGEQLADVDEMAMEEAILAVGEGRQRFPVPVRALGDDHYQAVAKAYLVEAVRRYNKQAPLAPIELEVRVFLTLPHDDAFRLLAQDVEQDHAPSSLARGQFFVRAVKQFGTEKAAADACRTSVAAVSKNLDVARCLPVIGHKVTVRRDIAQRDASWLMSQIGRHPKGTDAPDSATRKRLLDTIEGFEVTTAKKLFAALRGVVRTDGQRKPRRGVHPVVIDGRDIGIVRARKGDRVTIELAGAGDIPLDELMTHISAIIARTRN